MKYLAYLVVAFLVIVFSANKGMAQLDSTLQKCQEKMQLPYISDGQTYTALLNGDEAAEFYATFYGGSTYRLVGYSGVDEGNLIFSVYDQERNLLFTNADYQNTGYWDFEFESTLDCVIEAKLDAKHLSSGFAVMLIGFQQ